MDFRRSISCVISSLTVTLVSLHWQHITVICLFSIFRLKRTTDVMFGGKQVVVCGYGEVSQHQLILRRVAKAQNFLSWTLAICMSHLQCLNMQYYLYVGGQGLLLCSESFGSHCVCNGDRPYLCSPGLVRYTQCFLPSFFLWKLVKLSFLFWLHQLLHKVHANQQIIIYSKKKYKVYL